jgi:N-acetylglutamate synthase-like GNAT family acetyltransferase
LHYRPGDLLNIEVDQQAMVLVDVVERAVSGALSRIGPASVVQCPATALHSGSLYDTSTRDRSGGCKGMEVLMAVSMRAARDEDRHKLGALKLRSSLAWGDHIEELQALPEAREVPAEHLQYVIVAELHGEIAGFTTVLPGKDPLQAELEDLFVAPELWRRGIGRELLAEAERRATVLGVQSLYVITGERARPFYEASGFRFAGTVATEFATAAELLRVLP